jgi:hypothetical protein
MLVIRGSGEFFRIKMKQNGAMHRNNSRGKSFSVGFLQDTGRLIHFSEGQ